MTIKKIWHRISELKQIDGVPDSTRYDWIKKGLHPKPRKLGLSIGTGTGPPIGVQKGPL
jgi:predicted DNA-binding transcriptional regulator AlpA